MFFSEGAQREGFLREEPVPSHMEWCDRWLGAEPQESKQTLSLLFSPQAGRSKGTTGVSEGGKA